MKPPTRTYKKRKLGLRAIKRAVVESGERMEHYTDEQRQELLKRARKLMNPPSPPAFGLTAEQINKLREGKM